MNNNSYQQPEMDINLKEVIWDLLEQWKAVLITALLIALLVAGAKYYKDSNAYKASIRAKEEISQSGKTPEERISDVLDALSDDEKATVEFMVKQNEWIETEKEYLNNSILMNTNPTNQRTLLLDYYISMTDAAEAKMTALVYGYAGYLSDEKLVNAIGQIVAPDTETKYIAELISITGDNSRKGNSSGNENSFVVDSDADGAVMEVRVVLPDEVEATAVESAMTSSLSGYTAELTSKIGNHSIGLVKASEAYLYNSAAVNNRNNITSMVFNLQNNEKNVQSSLSDSQKSAVETIKAINREAKDNVASDKDLRDNNSKAYDAEMRKPGLSKKYALLGFVLGAMAYAFVYLLLVITRGRVRYASDVENYTQTRLLGEIYNQKEHKGIDKLFNSAFVDKYRYKNKLDSELQSAKTVDALIAACEHAGTKELTVLEIGSNGFSEQIDELVEKAKKQGLKFKRAEVVEDIDEKILASSPSVMLTINSGSRISDVSKLAALCKEYDANILGNVFNGTV